MYLLLGPDVGRVSDLLEQFLQFVGVFTKCRFLAEPVMVGCVVIFLMSFIHVPRRGLRRRARGINGIRLVVLVAHSVLRLCVVLQLQLCGRQHSATVCNLNRGLRLLLSLRANQWGSL